MKIEWTYLQVFDDGGLHHTWLAYYGPFVFKIKLESDGQLRDLYNATIRLGDIVIFRSTKGPRGFCYTRLYNAKRGLIRTYERLESKCASCSITRFLIEKWVEKQRELTK